MSRLGINRYASPYVPQSETKTFVVGESAPLGSILPGDYILTHENNLFAWLIRFGQWLVYWGKKRKYIHWNHAALIVSQDGDLIEALGRKGVKRTHLRRYKTAEYTVVHLSSDVASDGDRKQVVAYGEWAVGQEYGWITIVSIGMSLLFGGKFSFFFDGQSICSGLVARALERTNVIFDKSPSHIMPADLAYYFNVPVPPKGTARGKPSAYSVTCKSASTPSPQA